MSLAEGILWFLSTFVGCWGAALIVRGLRGEGIRKKWAKSKEQKRQARFRPTWKLVGLGVIMVAFGGFSMWIGTKNQINNQNSWMTIAHPMLIGVGVFGAMLGAWAAIGDRSKGRHRCPRCWYSMDGVSLEGENNDGVRCPECGREISCEADLLRARRSRKVMIAGALAMLVLAVGWPMATRVGRTNSIFGLIPNSVFVRLYFDWEDKPAWVDFELNARLYWGNPAYKGFDSAYLIGICNRITRDGDARAYLDELLTFVSRYQMRVNRSGDSIEIELSVAAQQTLLEALPLVLQGEIDLHNPAALNSIDGFANQLRKQTLHEIIPGVDVNEVFTKAGEELVYPDDFFQADFIGELRMRASLLTPSVSDEVIVMLERLMRQASARRMWMSTVLEDIACALQDDARFLSVLERSLAAEPWGDYQRLALATLAEARGKAARGKLFPIREIDRIAIERVMRADDENNFLRSLGYISNLWVDPLSCEGLLLELLGSGRADDRSLAASLIGLHFVRPRDSLAFMSAARSEHAEIRRFVIFTLQRAWDGAKNNGNDAWPLVRDAIETVRTLSEDPETSVSGPASKLLVQFEAYENSDDP